MALLQWANKAGNFQIKTNPIPISEIGFNPLLGSQILNIGLEITPENGQIFDAETSVELFKTSESNFSKKVK